MQSNMHLMLQTFDKYPIEGILPLTFGPRFIECAQQVVRKCMGESMDSYKWCGSNAFWWSPIAVSPTNYVAETLENDVHIGFYH